MRYPEYNVITPTMLDQMIKGTDERIRKDKMRYYVSKILANYEYYNGKQEIDDSGNYIYPTDNDYNEGKDYKPTKYWTNYFKAFIKRKSRWQMAGDHTIDVEPNSDSVGDYKFAQDTEDLLRKLWDDNGMDSKKMQIARDRLIAGNIAAKLSFNHRTGKLHWIWHKASEVFPYYSQDGFDELIGCDIIVVRDVEDEVDKVEYVRQTFKLSEDYTDCYLTEKVYDEQFAVKQVMHDNESLGFPFVPIVMFPVDALKSDTSHFDDLEDLKVLTRILNGMMEDANDSLRFEMFSMTVVKNADLPEGEELTIAPGALLKINAAQSSSHPADVESVENGFRWKEAYKDQYNRIKSALHELSGLPMIVPQELNFGGMNDRALQVLYQDIIQETTEHWLNWNEAFVELFTKSIIYLQNRTNRTNFDYDKTLVNKIDTNNCKVTIKFQLPLPDDRDNLVDLVTKEIDAGLESRKSAMKRLGVKNPENKEDEIYDEMMDRNAMNDPYGERVSEPKVTDKVESEVDDEETKEDTSVINETSKDKSIVNGK